MTWKSSIGSVLNKLFPWNQTPCVVRRKTQCRWETAAVVTLKQKQSWWKMKQRNGTSRQTGLKCGCSISVASSPALQGRCSAQTLSGILSFTNKADLNWCYHGDGNFLHVLRPPFGLTEFSGCAAVSHPSGDCWRSKKAERQISHSWSLRGIGSTWATFRQVACVIYSTESA